MVSRVAQLLHPPEAEDTCGLREPAQVAHPPGVRCVPLAAIEGLAIRHWVAEMHAEGLSASRIRQSYRLLRQILASAVDCGLLERDPTGGVKMPRGVRHEMSCLTAEEVERLAEAAPYRYRPLIHVIAYGGLRWGEATALRRRRCDLDAGLLIVAESLADVNGRAVFGMTKTYRVRKTRIPAFLVDDLRTHLGSCPRTQTRCCSLPRRAECFALRTSVNGCGGRRSRRRVFRAPPGSTTCGIPVRACSSARAFIRRDPAPSRALQHQHHDGPVWSPASRPIR